MSDIWFQSLRGSAIDLLEPRADQVDFREIADTLAHIIRFGGAAEKPVTVAQHTLICLKAAERENASPRLKALVLLHDAHESRLGDSITPVEQMRRRLHLDMFGPTSRDNEREVWSEAKHRHDIAIHEAARLEMPNRADAAFIRTIDLVALVTERRDFLARKPANWSVEVESTLPLRQKQIWLPPALAAAELYRAFEKYLPALANSWVRPARKRGAA